MRLTEFWDNMTETFGDSYVASVASDQTLPQLEGRTVNEALGDGWEAREIWIGICQAYPDRVPSRIRR